MGTFRAKHAQEELIKASPIPYSIVHATQFFEFIKMIADVSTEGETVRLPPVKIQPMAADDVARAVGKVAAGEPINGIADVAGPEVLRLDEFIRTGLTARSDPRPVVTDENARYFGIPIQDTALIPQAEAQLGSTTLDSWLSVVANANPPQTARAKGGAAAGSAR